MKASKQFTSAIVEKLPEKVSETSEKEEAGQTGRITKSQQAYPADLNETH